MVLTQSRIWTLIRSKENLFCAPTFEYCRMEKWDISLLLNFVARTKFPPSMCTQGVNVKSLWVKNVSLKSNILKNINFVWNRKPCLSLMWEFQGLIESFVMFWESMPILNALRIFKFRPRTEYENIFFSTSSIFHNNTHIWAFINVFTARCKTNVLCKMIM